MRERRDNEIFSLSFLDVICCGFGAVILLLVITKIYEPVTIERSQVKREGQIAALEQELFEIRGETVILNRTLKSVEEQLSEDKEQVARLEGSLTRIQGRYAATRDQFAENEEQQDELLAARQTLTEEMERLLANYRPDDNTTVGGVPVDSEYIIFVIDTSGSMFSGVWDLVLDRIDETLKVHPTVKGIQVLNDEGKYMFASYAGRWMPDSPQIRRQILSRLASWNPYSDSSPVEGITEAINTFYDPSKRISVYVYGDDFPRGSVEAVARYVDRVNRSDATGKRLMRIHAVGFPTQFGRGISKGGYRFANLMRVLCARNGGTFVGVSHMGERRMQIIIGGQGI